MVLVMLTAIVLLTAGTAAAVASLTRLCRDLMIGRLIKKLLEGTSPDQRFAVCERLAAALSTGDCLPGQGKAVGTGNRMLARQARQRQGRPIARSKLSPQDRG
jgi:hypothetical protein